MTQDAAQLVAGAHGLLQTWTEALWGGPIALLEDSQATNIAEETPPAAPTGLEGETLVLATVPEPSWADWDEWADLESEEEHCHNYRDPVFSSSSDSNRGPRATHRRRRMHAAFDDN